MRISPSILNCDFSDLRGELSKIRNADWAHVDIMDNHFVPNLTMGVPIVESIVGVSQIPVDTHLMIEDPDRWAPAYAEAGAKSVTFHAEAAAAPLRLARELRAMGVRAGLGLKPATPIEPYLDILDEFDMILIMTVEPGFGGQSFIESMMAKVARTRDAVNKSGLDVWIQVDGGISRETIEIAADAGADTFVAGSAVYKSEDAYAEVEALRELASRHTHSR
ncbi:MULTISPECIES: ribulose-phosphate 3-epimerase [Trueperella]|uniref:ribulose-phosphate 3-epimerase n=1 Tax=Trueperella TaxID=1069494 RepID=UPI0022EA5BCC|nr:MULTISPECIES: ribulose-phosphate 3-epimerase [Trueperella]MCI7305045.1 ribulose-phosphate 3-epimerase [Trueperella sp.]MDY5404052.1 ribulose-phosphate 3-epimerase [Trueperella sp.]